MHMHYCTYVHPGAEKHMKSYIDSVVVLAWLLVIKEILWLQKYYFQGLSTIPSNTIFYVYYIICISYIYYIIPYWRNDIISENRILVQAACIHSVLIPLKKAQNYFSLHSATLLNILTKTILFVYDWQKRLNELLRKLYLHNYLIFQTIAIYNNQWKVMPCCQVCLVLFNYLL